MGTSSLYSLYGKISHQPESYERKGLYKFGPVLGAGTYGIVKEATVAATGDRVAVKVILKDSVKGNVKMIYEELDVLRRLNHPHIVKFVDWFESKEKFYLVTQLATGGELFDRICERGKYTEQDAVETVREILEAVAYLHDLNIVHRDLKPENLLYVDPSPTSELVLADFGIAKTLESKDEVLTSMAGSFGYAAPEVLRGSGHGKPCDVWSLGVITYTLLCGYSPFRSENIEDFLLEVRENGVIFHERYWRGVSEEAKEFILCMLRVNPAKRLTCKDLLDHHWISGKTATSVDLLPNIREGFNARSKLLQAIEAVKLANRIKALDMDDDSDDEDRGRSPAPVASPASTVSSLEVPKAAAGQRRSSFGQKGNATMVFQEVVRAVTRIQSAGRARSTSAHSHASAEDE
ncbi:kinase-like domain-containing protein [Dipodascopsis tothii]|uniref:kinase-like domain-containing protein n=1 Tax=Dipodascopsis tothii TaxID=44089 RepID=UPI0034CF80E1